MFPWKYHKASGLVVKSSISIHYNEVVTFVKEHINSVPNSLSYKTIPDAAVFYDIIWVLSLLDAAPPEFLYNAVQMMHPDKSDNDLRNILFALRVCRWVDVFSYSGKDYYYQPINHDPFIYSFLKGKRVRDIDATKMDIVTEFRKEASISKAISLRLIEKRRGA